MHDPRTASTLRSRLGRFLLSTALCLPGTASAQDGLIWIHEDFATDPGWEGVHNHIIANNALALKTAQKRAEQMGYQVLNLGPDVAGETRQVARTIADLLRGIVRDGQPLAPPACVLIGGETTVTLGSNPGKGGRNTEFVLAALLALEPSGIGRYVILSGGTDGEDGPTDAAGATGDPSTLARAARQGFDPAEALRRHDSYTLFHATGDLLRTGLTDTNVMDVRVLLIGAE